MELALRLWVPEGTLKLELTGGGGYRLGCKLRCQFGPEFRLGFGHKFGPGYRCRLGHGLVDMNLGLNKGFLDWFSLLEGSGEPCKHVTFRSLRFKRYGCSMVIHLHHLYL